MRVLPCLRVPGARLTARAPSVARRFSYAGPAGPSNFEGGVQGYETRAFRGLGIYQAMPYEVSDDTDSLQMLQRSTQVGEFYRIAPPTSFQKDELSKNWGDIVIYDEESDRHVRIAFEKALRACNLDNPAFNGVDVFGIKDKSASDFGVPADKVSLAGLSAAELGVPGKTTQAILDAYNLGNWMPVGIVLARPFIEHLMMSAVMAVAGRDTGATLFGPADMQISANTSVKTIEGHYTCHTKSVITKEQNVMVLRDIMCNGYVAGGNTRFFGERKGSKVFDPQDIVQDMEDRLSFTDQDTGDYGSILAFACPYDDGENRDQVISISHRLLPWEVTMPKTTQKTYFPGGPAHHAAYSQIYQLGNIHFGEDIQAAENMEFISQGSVNNALCFVGPHRVYSPWSQTHYELRPGQGHFGPDALPGDARWRRGESVSLEASRNSMVSIEAAAQSQLVFGKK